jgi:transcription antitermination factor NusA-like protein
MTRRGGDIDLYIETYITDVGEALDKRGDFWWDLQKELGEQRIDVVLNIIPLEHESLLPIYQVAKSEGIKIV